MATRTLTFKILVAGCPLLIIVAGLGVWLSLGSRHYITEQGGGGVSSDLVEDPSGTPSSNPSSGVLDGAGESAPERPDRGTGDRSIAGTVLVPHGDVAARAEAVLVTVDLAGSAAEPGGASPDARGVAELEAEARDFARRVAKSPRLSVSSGGRFEFVGVEPGAFRVVARGEGFLPDVSDVVIVNDESPPVSVELTLEPAATLDGVVSTLERAPVEGARVEAERRGDPDRPVVPAGAGGKELFKEILSGRSGAGRTDASGRFTIADLGGGRYDLVIRAEGFARGRIADARADGGTLQIYLRPQLLLRGEVVDRAAEPIAEAEVRLAFLAADASDPHALVRDSGRESADPGAVHRARTDSDGQFIIDGLARGAYRAEVDSPGYLRAIVPMVAVHEESTDEERHLTFELEEGHRIHGIVHSRQGDGEGEGDEASPLGDARVRVRYGGPIAAGDEASDATDGTVMTSAERRVDFREASGGSRWEEIVQGGQGNRSMVTDAGGVFDFTSLPEGVYEVEVSASFHRPVFVDDLPTDGEPLEIVLEPGRPVEGRVVDQRSGDPVPRARVSFFPLEGPPRATSGGVARTGADGSFRIDSLPPGRHGFLVESEGYQTLEIERDEPDPDTDRDALWTLELKRSGSVSGRVLAGSELSVEGLRVSLVLHEPDPALTLEDVLAPPRPAIGRSRRIGSPSYTDEDGFYHIFVPAAGSYRVVVNGQPYVEASSELFDVPDGRQIEDVDIPLLLEATVQGVIVARDLGRVAGARVRILPALSPVEDPTEASHPPEVGSQTGEREARTDATGAFTVRGVRAGSYRVVASAPGYIKARSEVFELASGSAHLVELELEPEMTIAGHVVGGGAETLTFAEVRATVVGESRREFWSEERTIVSALGTFRLSRLANRPYDLRVTAPEFASALLEGVPAGSEDVVVRLERLVSLSGKVIGAFTDEPAEEFVLTLELDGADRLSSAERKSIHRPRTFRDPGGAFSIDGLPPGRYLVQVEARDHLEAEPVELVLPIDEGLRDEVIALVEVGVIAGVVLDSFNEPIAGATVEALERWQDPDSGRITYRPLRSSSRRSTEHGEREGSRRSRPGRGRAERDGSFAMRDLPDGVYRLSITHDDHVPRDLGDYSLENGWGGDAAVAVRAFLATGVILRGRVRGLEEAQGGAVSVDLRPTVRDRISPRRRGSGRKSARVDDSGLFEMRGLETGEYELYARYRRVSDGSFRSLRRTIRIGDVEHEKGVLLDLSR